jgi:hypothetical protein
LHVSGPDERHPVALSIATKSAGLFATHCGPLFEEHLAPA